MRLPTIGITELRDNLLPKIAVINRNGLRISVVNKGLTEFVIMSHWDFHSMNKEAHRAMDIFTRLIGSSDKKSGMSNEQNHRIVSVTAARRDFLGLGAELRSDPEKIIVLSRRGSPVVVLMGTKAYDGLYAAAQLSHDRSALKQTAAAIRRMDRGEGIPCEEFRERLAKRRTSK